MTRTPPISESVSGRPVMEVDRLVKTFRVHRRAAGIGQSLRSVLHRADENIEAVRDVSFTIAEGEIVGFLGPNGAGKTTTLKCLSGLLHPQVARSGCSASNPSNARPTS